MKKILFAATMAALSIVPVLVANSASAATVSSYDGYYGSGQYIDPFFASNGYNTNDLPTNFTASDLAGSSLVILSLYNSVYSDAQVSALDSYVSGGGRLLLQSDGAGFEAAQTSENQILTSLGSSIVNSDGSFDPEQHTTTTIANSPFTDEVTSIDYAYTSALTGGTTLVTGDSGQSFVAEQAIGSGYVFATSDINVQSFLQNTDVQNGQLYLDFATANGNGSVSAAPEPGTWALMFGGLAMVGGALRIGRKRGAGSLSVA